MRNNIAVLHYGISNISDKWAFSLNHTTFIDRVYYIYEEGAGYIENGKKHYFIKNHIYIINHSARIEFFAENYNFYHAYIDYTSADTQGYDKVIDIAFGENPLIKADMESILYILSEDIKNRKSVGKLFPYNERLVMALETILYDTQKIYGKKNVENTLVSRALLYIHSHYGSEISVQDIAESEHISKNHFTRIFTKETGMTPYYYIKEYRFNIAVSMIENGASIGEASVGCGFLSAAAFSNSFKKRFGFSPKKLIEKEN